MLKKTNDYLIPLRVVRRLVEDEIEGKTPKIKKTTRMNEYFDRYEILKVEPLIHSKTLKRIKTGCIIYYKPNSTYYEISETVKEVMEKINSNETTEDRERIGFKYKNKQ